MEDYFYQQSNEFEKLTLLLTSGFWSVLQTVIKGNSPFTKVDIAVVDDKGLIVYSYNNGTEVNHYIIDSDLSSHFVYAPGEYHFDRDAISNINSKRDTSILKKQVSLLFQKWEDQTRDDYPRDLIAPVEYLGKFRNTKVFAALIGYSHDWQYIKMIQKLFNSYITHWDAQNILRTNKLRGSLSLDDVSKFTDKRSIIHNACEKELVSRFYSMRKNKPNNSESLFDIVCALSVLTYESAPNNGVIGFVSQFNSMPELHVLFQKPIMFSMDNTREIRKLLEMTREDMILLIKEGTVIGIGDGKSIPSKLSFKGNGKWVVSSNKGDIFSVIGNSCSISPSVESSNLPERYLACFGNKDGLRFVEKIIKAAKKQRHGTSIIISEAAHDEMIRLCEHHRAIAIDPIQLTNNDDLTEAITNIDGAILIDEKGVCHAIGAILDGDAVIPGKTARGARYNSLCNYVERLFDRESKLSIAVIISEDRSMDIYPEKRRLEEMKELRDDKNKKENKRDGRENRLTKKKTINLYDTPLSAGSGNVLLEGMASFEKYETTERNCDFALRISGDSMEPDIPSGSIVCIRRQQTINPGEIGVFLYNGEVYCKKYSTKNNQTYLISLNRKYKPILVEEGAQFICYGKVVHVELPAAAS